MKSSDTTLLIIPGLNDSGPDHWQSYWLKKFSNSKKVNQDNWDEPQLNQWLHNLNTSIETTNGPIILVGHSLGVSLVLHWAKQYTNGKVKGALLVSTSDVDSPHHTPEEVRNFSPMPLIKLPFPSIVVASDDDAFVSPQRAAFFASQWGSELISIGKKGHINAASKLEYWDEGISILKKLLD